MDFSGCLNDGDLGPGVQGCRDDFDFTLKFEKIFLSILPAAIFIPLSLPRIVYLVRRPSIAQGLPWKIAKQVRSHLCKQAAALTLPARFSLAYTPRSNLCSSSSAAKA